MEEEIAVWAPTAALKVGWQSLGTVASVDCWFVQPKRLQGSQAPEDPWAYSSDVETASSYVIETCG